MGWILRPGVFNPRDSGVGNETENVNVSVNVDMNVDMNVNM
jgi:hypothetical protein